jgi:SEC-C motif
MTDPTRARPGRNEPCHCGSGRKYKHCCLAKDEELDAAARAKAAAEQAEAATTESETTPHGPARPRKPETSQPWKRTSRGFMPRARMPRKVGGS